MRFIKLLAKAGLIKIQKSDIKKAVEKEDLSFLNYAHSNGLYHIRLETIRELTSLDNEKIVPILKKAIYDKIPAISILAIETLVRYSTPEILLKIEKRLEFWESESKKKKFLRKSKRKPPYTHHWDDSRMRELKQEAIKNMKSFGERAAYL